MTHAVDAQQLTVVRGGVTAEELAALVVVINSIIARTDAQQSRAAALAEWNAPHRSIRKTLPHGINAWRRSALPH